MTDPAKAEETSTPVSPDRDQEEMDVFFRGNHTLRLSNGKNIPIPKLSWGREGKVIRCFGKMLAEIPALKKIATETGKVTGSDIMAVLPEVLAIAPEYITEMVIHLSGLSKTVVEDDLEIEDVINIIYPFFPRIGKLLSRNKFLRTEQEKPEESPTS